MSKRETLDYIERLQRSSDRQEAYTAGVIVGGVGLIRDQQGTLFGRRFNITVEWVDDAPSQDLIDLAYRTVKDYEGKYAYESTPLPEPR